MTFDQALRKMPRCVGGLDLFAQSTVDDLCYLVELEMDYYEGPDGHESTIKTKRQYASCKRFLEVMQPYR